MKSSTRADGLVGVTGSRNPPRSSSGRAASLASSLAAAARSASSCSATCNAS